LVEIDAGCAVDDDVAGVDNEFQVFGAESDVLLLKVSFTRIITECTWV
jgi:hypothetical protein